jgi:hypothetical protein
MDTVPAYVAWRWAGTATPLSGLADYKARLKLPPQVNQYLKVLEPTTQLDAALLPGIVGGEVVQVDVPAPLHQVQTRPHVPLKLTLDLVPKAATQAPGPCYFLNSTFYNVFFKARSRKCTFTVSLVINHSKWRFFYQNDGGFFYR